MEGRRQRQKAARERRILRAAEQLFAQHGYAHTGMEDIARRARLAVGTIYNYFPSKPEIVLALMRRETEVALAAGEAVVKRPPRDPARAVNALFEVYVDLVVRHDRRQLRELLAAAMAHPDTIAAAAFEVDLRLVQQLVALLARLRDDGRLLGDFELGRAATTLYAVYVSWFLAFAASDSVSEATLRSEIREGLKLMLRGLVA